MKEFEEMQIVWDRQNDQKLYAINEAALHTQIKRKSQSIERKLALVELIMIAVNFIVGVILLIDSIRDGDQRLIFLFPALYLGYSAFAIFRRVARRKEEVHFEPTMLGDLDKAIWRINYLIRQGRWMMAWYLLPLMLAFTVFALINDRVWWALALILVVTPATYLAGRWETGKFYLPKKRDLESLREKLTAPEA